MVWTALAFALAGIAGFGAGLLVGWWTYRPLMARRQRRRARRRYDRLVGRPAPDVVSTTVSGRPWRLTDHRGKIVVLDFWATWCGPCVAAIPNIKKLHAKHSGRADALLVGVSLDETAGELTAFCQEKGIEWLQLFEPGAAGANSVARAFGVHVIPDICIVDKDGTVRGIRYSSRDVDKVLEELLGG